MLRMLAQLNRVLVVDSSNDGSLLSDADFVVLFVGLLLCYLHVRHTLFHVLHAQDQRCADKEAFSRGSLLILLIYDT